jgi:hypothetical protein
MEPQLRALAMPTCLKRGVVTLNEDYTICTQGQTLTPEQARLLVILRCLECGRPPRGPTPWACVLPSPPRSLASQKLFEKPMATFHIVLLAGFRDGQLVTLGAA